MKNFTRAMVVYGSFRYGKSELGGQNQYQTSNSTQDCRKSEFYVKSWEVGKIVDRRIGSDRRL